MKLLLTLCFLGAFLSGSAFAENYVNPNCGDGMGSRSCAHQMAQGDKYAEFDFIISNAQYSDQYRLQCKLYVQEYEPKADIDVDISDTGYKPEKDAQKLPTSVVMQEEGGIYPAKLYMFQNRVTQGSSILKFVFSPTDKKIAPYVTVFCQPQTT